MTTTNIFEIASRNKFRYPYKGLISTEDLWDLNLDQLDSVFKALNKDSYDKRAASLLITGNGTDEILQTKIEIVKYVFDVKVTEANEREYKADIAAKKRRIMDILEKKQNNALENMSEEELMMKLAELG